MPVFVLVVTLVLAPGVGVLSLRALARPAVLLLVVGIALTRLGVLATVASVFAHGIILDFPLTTNWSTWFAYAALVGVATLVGLAFFGFVTTLARLDGIDLIRIEPVGYVTEKAQSRQGAIET